LKNEAAFIRRLLSEKHKNEAFREFLDLYQERLYWHIRKLVVTHENADDVLQNTFLRIYKNLPNFKQKSSLNTWMFRIAYNESLRFLENQKKKGHYALDDVAARYLNNLVSDPYFEGDEIQMKLQNILGALPEKERQIFQMKYYDDLKFREIEAVLGMKESTIKTSYYKTVKLIQNKIQSTELLTASKV
jgi:RNA polymerase sigma-70 factor (ECF subfamily)